MMTPLVSMVRSSSSVNASAILPASSVPQAVSGSVLVAIPSGHQLSARRRS